MTTPEQIAALAQEVYDAAAPTLEVHNLCQLAAMIVLDVCAARGVPARLGYSPHHRETSNGPHFWVELPDHGAVIDMLGDRRFRVRTARRASAA